RVWIAWLDRDHTRDRAHSVSAWAPMKQRDYSKLSTATLVKIQGRSAHDSAEERTVREELRRRREDWFALGKDPNGPGAGRLHGKRPKQLQLFPKETR